VERRIKKKTSLFAWRDCLTKHRIRIISIGDEGEEKRADGRVCAWCYRVIQEGRSPATHGICPECAEKEMVRYLEEIKAPPGGLR
jgi:predicted RNA-binding Zn-ribbon protein involved in translation (DUF1610 family)